MALVLLGGAGAQGQGDPSSRDARRRTALALYAEGVKRYHLAEYDQAIELFRRAYLLSEAPELLFNIGQAYRLKGAGHCATALTFYQSYLRVAPTTPKRASVEAAIADMALCARHETPAPSGPAGALLPTPGATPPAHTAAPPETALTGPAPAPAPRARSTRRLLGVVLGGVGLASAVAGGAALVWARLDYDATKSSGCAPECDPQVVDGLRTRRLVGYTLLAAGVVAGAAGLVLWLPGRAAKSHHAFVRPSGAGVELGARF